MDDEDREVLYRVDERTRRIDARIHSIEDGVIRNDADIDKLERNVSRNTTVVNAVTLGASSSLAAFLAWFAGLFH